jgi:UDP-glucose 4-epimerase
MNILITGICGFIGSHLADRFLKEGHDVSGVDNLETGRFENSPVAFEHVDIADRQDFYNVANRSEPDLVVHCAASYKDPNKWHTDTDSNVTGTINAALVAKHHGANLVVCDHEDRRGTLRPAQRAAAPDLPARERVRPPERERPDPRVLQTDQ